MVGESRKRWRPERPLPLDYTTRPDPDTRPRTADSPSAPHPTMDSQDYTRLADACLDRVADWLEPFDPDEVDFSTADGVVKIEFPDGTTYVLNRQAGANQMWFAAGVSAWHYDWNGSAWANDRDGHDLFENISRVVSEKLGRQVSLA